ncbi:hypothetical protein DEU56DRAFT_755949 [Suillus clintonianus]|uniref:uncharacterized protein n=1 Tax=Suillus clintonianus TaxID=1904413 RepID=UPI001B86170B|nr:uncharacterized protein DEU56DRAFT_755949 [Suillus clintonianus]KAG2137912.1 hypothetical protein DEU56DRAFT_755949 [Suillus clintonianus]
MAPTCITRRYSTPAVPAQWLGLGVSGREHGNKIEVLIGPNSTPHLNARFGLSSTIEGNTTLIHRRDRAFPRVGLQKQIVSLYRVQGLLLVCTAPTSSAILGVLNPITTIILIHLESPVKIEMTSFYIATRLMLNSDVSQLPSTKVAYIRLSFDTIFPSLISTCSTRFDLDLRAPSVVFECRWDEDKPRTWRDTTYLDSNERAASLSFL